MEYSSFRINALVDWVEIQVKFEAATNAQTIRRHFPDEVAPFVTPIEASANGTARIFSFRLQNPQSPSDASALLDSLSLRFPFSEPPTVNGVEISLDAYSKSANSGALVDMAENFYRTNKRQADFRIQGLKGTQGDVEFEANKSRTAIRSAIAAGKTMIAGNVGDPISQRVYVKTTDNAGRLNLQLDEHRARIEVTLTGRATPFTTTDEWQKFDFAKLARPYFSFLTLTQNLTPMQALIADSEVKTRLQWSPDSSTRFSQQTRRQKPSVTRADSKLNDRARDALRALTKRQQRRPESAEIRVRERL